MRAVSKLVVGGIDRFCDSLEDVRLRGFVRQPFLAASLVDILPIYPLTAHLAALLSAPYKEFLRAGIPEQARYDAGHVFRRLYDGAQVDEMPARITRFEGQYYDFGRSDCTLEGPGHMVLRLHRAPAYVAPWLSTMKAAYTEEAARIIGASDAQCTARHPAPDGEHDGFPLVTIACELRWW